jgi:hypothetical protein
MADIDFDRDGKVTEEEIHKAKEIYELERFEEKSEAQKRMAWLSMFMVLGFTGLMFSEFISVERLNALSAVLDWFYITQAGVIGAYMGVTAWANRK